MFLKKIRESHSAKVVSMILALELISNYFVPNQAHALTTGPSQPEVQSFQPVGTSDMVNVFTGDFSYNIPLLDVDGYPINISYASGVGMDQEASWVGLGWNINPGAINRSMRGIPDDFDGDVVTKTMNMKPNRSFGASFSKGAEAFGLDFFSIDYGISVNYNNYQGVGFETSLTMELNSAKGAKGILTGDLGVTSGADGINLSPSISYSRVIERNNGPDVKATGKLGLSFNSRSGLKQLTLSASAMEYGAFMQGSDGGIKNSSQTYSTNGGASINFSTHTYTPQVTMPMINASLALSIKWGGTAYGLDGTHNISGYYSEQDLEHKSIQVPAFGYFNSQDGMKYSNGMQDLNREKEVAFTDQTPDLPVTNYSYDIYSVNGQGIGGNYRAFRSDLGTISDPAARTYSLSGNLGLEDAVGNTFHAGTDITITDVTTTSGKWSGSDNASDSLKFRTGTHDNNPLFEPWYFKQAGEKAVDSDPALFAAIGGSDPVKVALQSGGSASMQVTAENSFDRYYTNGHEENIPFASTNYRDARQRRNQPISFLYFRDSAFALQPSILEHTDANMPAYSGAAGHHIGEITTLRSDGARYVYGLPAYNIDEKDVTFAVQGRSHNCSTGIVTYNTSGPNPDNSTSNKLGIDNYYSSTETPAYAHSYMLTSIISPDYVDYDGVEGPSKGDLGSYTKFNYTKNNSDFKWRTPIGTNSASYNEGMKSESSDDKGSYVYGEKEIWYLKSVETKNYIAVFKLSDREDGYGVTGENGSVGGTALQKLDRIDLYTKPDYDSNGVNATPIKTVHFEYDYSQCPGVPNRIGSSGTGKLTLKKIYFTYQKSFKAKLSDYEFAYSDNDQNGSAEANFSYNLKGYDRWGNYKRNPSSSSCGVSDSLTTAEFPYTDQDTALVNKYAAAWSLTSIKLPSGGTIKVKYESDDYAYVQDRKAQQMFKVTDVRIASTDPTSYAPSTTTYPRWDSLMQKGNYGDNYYIYFKLQRPISNAVSTSDAADTILKKYLGDSLKNIYFRFLVDITNSGDYEYVSGYFDVGNFGVSPAVGGQYQYGWIEAKKVPFGDRVGSDFCNPICKTAWQYGRLNLPRKVWDQPDPQENAVEQVVEELTTLPFATAVNLLNTFKKPNKIICEKKYGLAAIMNKSWIRLNSPYQSKLGGGSRVKSVTIGDNWKSMTTSSATPNDAQYGQVYSYTTTDAQTNATISSGVASYEPQLGGDENPFRRPVFFNDQKRFVPDDESYLEEPFGEMFFPGPGVGYSRVTVRNLQYADVNRHATGYTVQEFYTAKDFPTICRQTPLEAIHKRTNPILSLLRVTMKDYMTASEGYVIENNDMHGKPSAQYVYAEGQSQPISEVHYFYKLNKSNGKQLDNTVDVINKDGTVSQGQSGLDYDFVNDMREEQSKTISGGLNLNVAGFLAAIFPAVVPTIFPTFTSEDTRFRSTVVTKVINRYGILSRTEAHDAGSTVTTENLAWDAETGELLVTKTKNDFEDPIYNFTYPAHWAYDQMGQAYKNLMTGFSGVSISSGSATITNASDYFVAGDEIGITDNSGDHYKAWVCSVVGSTLNLIDKTGAVITGVSNPCTLLITRSGRRNQQALAIGGVTLLTNPLVDTNNDSLYDSLQYHHVINAKAQEYAQHWMMFGGHVSPGYTTCNCSPGSKSEYVANFLHQITANGHLLTDSTLLYDYSMSTYHEGYGSNLNSSLPSSQDISWFPSAIGQTLIGWVAHGPDSTGCSVTLQLPAPYTWDQVTALNSLSAASNPGNCSDGTSYQFTMVATLSNGSTVTITGYTPCWEVGTSCDRSTGESTTCGKLVGDAVNPYFEDILGVWRPLRSSLYLADRVQATSNDNVDIRKDGYFFTHDHTTGDSIGYQAFWKPNSGRDWLKDSTYWTWSSEVTKYTPFSNEVENRDALSRYSAAVFGYNHSLPIAVASNARYQEIAYDGFEDYAYLDPSDCRYQHFNFYENRTHLSTVQAHTGMYSMKVNASDSMYALRPLTSYQSLPAMSSCPYLLSENDFVGTFSPITYSGDKKYVLNYWVREDTLTAPVFNYPDGKVTVKFINSTGTASYPTMLLVQKSDIIEGWQQYQYTFTIPAGTSGAIEVVLKNTGAKIVYFDDIRLHPFDSNMKSYVYHPTNLRFVSELDENNYATFYDYDEEGALTRVKKETVKGIMTIKESRNNSSH